MSIDDLRACFSGRLLTQAEDVAPFLTDWRTIWQGRARAVVQPDTTADVAAVVRWCADRRVPIVAQGGNTGMSGGAVPDVSGTAIVLSLTRLARIRSVDPVDNTLVAEAGCTLASVQDAARDVDRLFPLSLAAEGSCTIGGNLATNAGGTAVLRYGSTRHLCLGLEVVTADGDIWNGLRALHKDNSGYDLRDLFIGSEGTLGIITAAVLKLFPRPRATATAYVAVADPAAALALFGRARDALDAHLTGFELQGEDALALVLRHSPDTRRPLAPAAWYVLIEASGDESVRATLENLLAAALGDGLASDAIIAESETQARALWRLRESIGAAQTAAGPVIKHDISVPVSRIPAFLVAAEHALDRWRDTLQFVTFGHIGDGNLHYNFSPRGGDMAAFEQAHDAISLVVHDLVASLGGSVSAEHGLGVLRRDDAARYRPAIETAMQRRIKTALDPLGILNPGKMIA